MVNRKNQEQLLLRLPPGLKDRIKAVAETNDRSLSAEIVRVLEREYPEPQSLAARFNDLISMVTELRDAVYDEKVDELIDSLDDTLKRIAHGDVPDVSDDVRETIRRRRAEWADEKPAVPNAEEYTEEELRRIQRREAFGKKRK